MYGFLLRMEAPELTDQTELWLLADYCKHLDTSKLACCSASWMILIFQVRLKAGHLKHQLLSHLQSQQLFSLQETRLVSSFQLIQLQEVGSQIVHFSQILP